MQIPGVGLRLIPVHYHQPHFHLARRKKAAKEVNQGAGEAAQLGANEASYVPSANLSGQILVRSLGPFIWPNYRMFDALILL
jgi:hypothetical protein